MSLHSIESWLGQPEHGKIYFADTNFLFKSVHLTNADEDKYAVEDHKLLREFRKKLLDCGCTIFFNSTTRHELLRLLRQLMVRAALSDGDIDGKKIAPEIVALQTTREGEMKMKSMDRFLKDVLREGYIKFFNDLLGENGEWIRQEYDRVIQGCRYKSYGASLSWADAEKTMAQYGLDACDAMIVNAGVSTADCVGLLTADSDFRYCYAINGFDIIMPNRLIGNRKARALDPYSDP